MCWFKKKKEKKIIHPDEYQIQTNIKTSKDGDSVMSVLVKNTLKRKIQSRMEIELLYGEMKYMDPKMKKVYDIISNKLNIQIQILEYLVTKEDLGEIE